MTTALKLQVEGNNLPAKEKFIPSSDDLFVAIARQDLSMVTKLERNLTPAIAFNKTPLSTFRKNWEDVLFDNLEALLVKLSMSLNLGKNLEQWQITEIAQDLYQKYYYMSLEEFILVLKKGRNGEWGKVYDRIDGAVIMEWFEKYDTSDERLALVQQKRVKQALQDKEETDNSMHTIFQHPKMQDLVQTMSQNFQLSQDSRTEEDYQQFRVQYYKQRILNHIPAKPADTPNPQSDFP